MQILMAGPFPEKPPMVAGGIQAVTWQLASALLARGHHVETFSSERVWDDAPAARWSRQHGLIHSVYRQSSQRLPHVATSLTEDAWTTRAAARAARPDVVHGHGQDGSSLGAILSGLPHVITPHGLQFQEKRARAGSRVLSADGLRQLTWTRLESWILGHARHVIVISPYVLEQIQPLVRGTCHMIENPIGDEFFIDPAMPDGPPTLLTIGWLHPRKRQEILLHAVAEARQRIPELRLVVVGGDSADGKGYGPKLRTLAADLGIADAVEFLSGLSEEEILEQYRRCTAYVHAAQEESSPMVVLQAMSAARPVIAVDIPGIRHLVTEGVTGYRVPGPDPLQFAKILVEALERPDHLAELGRNARSDAEARFRASSVAVKTEDVYQLAISER